jgi:hypothetical protein
MMLETGCPIQDRFKKNSLYPVSRIQNLVSGTTCYRKRIQNFPEALAQTWLSMHKVSHF